MNLHTWWIFCFRAFLRYISIPKLTLSKFFRSFQALNLNNTHTSPVHTTMTLVHRALFTWFVTLNFVIFLSLRLELRTQWNFFFVFIPLWIFDAILLVYVIIRIITKWRNLARLKELLMGYQWYIAAVLLKIAGQTMICLKLEYPHLDIPIYVTMIPIWALLSTSVTYVFIQLIRTK